MLSSRAPEDMLRHSSILGHCPGLRPKALMPSPQCGESVSFYSLGLYWHLTSTTVLTKWHKLTKKNGGI